ncbi:MAG: galactokinase [Ruminococcaceae bacterium]|nr:galactokinase [Oscillospiraceae bacterium]
MNYENRKLAVNAFEKAYGTSLGLRVFFAPGRVNLIGEHIDYNGGFVLPCALSLGTYAAVRLRSDSLFCFYSDNFADEKIVECDLNDLKLIEGKTFANYPIAVLLALKDNGYSIEKGLNIAYYGNLPINSGLSSSASIEVLTAYICKVLFRLDLDNITLAKICQQAENKYIGVNCGIMDQFTIVMGKADHAIFLNTATLEYEYVPVNFTDSNITLVISQTNKKRTLADSKYNERFVSCQKEKAMYNVENLCDLPSLPVDASKIVRHIVTENQRTIKAKEALENNDFELLGKLMNESHKSLKEDYEVTGIELDTLVETAQRQKGVLGSRMTGAGFGGCTVSLVKSENVDSFIKNVGDVYREKMGFRADFLSVNIGKGPCEV